MNRASHIHSERRYNGFFTPEKKAKIRFAFLFFSWIIALLPLKENRKKRVKRVKSKSLT